MQNMSPNIARPQSLEHGTRGMSSEALTMTLAVVRFNQKNTIMSLTPQNGSIIEIPRIKFVKEASPLRPIGILGPLGMVKVPCLPLPLLRVEQGGHREGRNCFVNPSGAWLKNRGVTKGITKTYPSFERPLCTPRARTDNY